MHSSGRQTSDCSMDSYRAKRVARGREKNGLPSSRTAARSCSLVDTCSNSSYCICPEKKNDATSGRVRGAGMNVRFRRGYPRTARSSLYRARMAVGSSVQMRPGSNASAISRASGVAGQNESVQPRAMPSATIARSAVAQKQIIETIVNPGLKGKGRLCRACYQFVKEPSARCRWGISVSWKGWASAASRSNSMPRPGRSGGSR